MSRLDSIIAQTREALVSRKDAVAFEELEGQVGSLPQRRAFAQSLGAPGMSLIAEHKRRSPSAGAIREDLDLAEVVSAYERGGASALSILTEESNFGGSLEDLRAAKVASSLPVLRKDFIVDSYQVVEAAVAGADAILLIVAALSPSELAELSEYADSLGLDVLTEVHDAHEVDIALEAGAHIIGINNRDLKDFSVDLQRTYDLLSDVPAGKIVVAESGIKSRAQVESLEDVGVDAVLVGETLMRSDDLQLAAKELLNRT